MSLKYRDSAGTETPVAGLNGTSGELVPSVSLMQSGTITIPQTAASGMGTIPVTFATPMPDTDYTLNFEITGNAWYNLTLQSNKTANGFTVVYQNVDKTASSATATVKWTAFKLMTDTVHEADSAHISQNTANFAPAFSDSVSYAVGDYVTYNNVLYRCTTAHTAGVWVAGHFTQVTVGSDLSDLNSVVPSNASASNKLVSSSALNGLDITGASGGEGQRYGSSWMEVAKIVTNAVAYARNSVVFLFVPVYGGSTKFGMVFVDLTKGTATELANTTIAVSGGLEATDFGGDIEWNGDIPTLTLRCKAPKDFAYYNIKVLSYSNNKPTLVTTVLNPTVAPTGVAPSDVVKV